MSGPIALLTDFGVEDIFVGTMKAVMLDLAPQSIVFDLSHQVPRHDVRRGARLLSRVARYLPRGCVTLAVVDPGVGSARRPLVVAKDGRFYVGPDNGIFTPLLDDAEVVWANEPRFWRPSVSATFHGRDIFAPLAAHVATGMAISRMGVRVQDAVRLSWPQPTPSADGFDGEVVDVDAFGNLATNIPGVEGQGTLRVGDQTLGLSHCYSDCPVGTLLALVDSDGWLEIAVNQGSAAERLGHGLGLKVSWHR